MKNTIEDQMAEEQAGFRTGRGTNKQIFSLRLIAEKYLGAARQRHSLTSRKRLIVCGTKAYRKYCIIMASIQSLSISCRTPTKERKAQSVLEPT